MRITYTKMLAMQRVHIQRFVHTMALRNLECETFSPSFLPVLVAGSSGRPTERGSSRRPTNSQRAPTTPRMAGIQKHQRQASQCWAYCMICFMLSELEGSRLRFLAMVLMMAGSPLMSVPMLVMMRPQKKTAAPAPIECEVFHIDIFVASSDG